MEIEDFDTDLYPKTCNQIKAYHEFFNSFFPDKCFYSILPNLRISKARALHYHRKIENGFTNKDKKVINEYKGKYRVEIISILSYIMENLDKYEL